MYLLADLVQPITTWLQVHPQWALFLAFIISLAESLAIIGSIIPGSVTMTAIGILAGSGVMRVDLTLIAATLGAIAGDGLSYLLGYTFSDRMNSIWPFQKHPNLLTYGKTYFINHGGKSVLIGRFVGPLRSIIPLIAGMMHMSHLRFFAANAISAIAWALVYVLPGVLIGAASSELSPESATRLFALVLIFLGGLWLLSLLLRWAINHVNIFLSAQFHDFWLWSSKHPRLSSLIQYLTPEKERNHSQTAAFCLGALFFGLLFILITFLVIQDYAASVNKPSYYFLQSLRTAPFDVFFIILSECINAISLSALSLFLFFLTIYYRDWRSLIFWLSINVTCLLVLILSHSFIENPGPEGFLVNNTHNSYPALLLTFATAQFTALLFYLNTHCKDRLTRSLNIILPLILLLNGIALLYLGDNWLMDVLGAYFCGISICFFYWLLYRRQATRTPETKLGFGIVGLLLLSTSVSLYLNYELSIRTHQPYFAQYVFTEEEWWDQKKPLLPVYRSNRIGKRISLFNLQYTGTLAHLEGALLNDGWTKEKESLFWSILKRVNGQPKEERPPLMAQLYLNKKPVMVMTYQDPTGKTIHTLRIWRSNYHLRNLLQPIWLGTVSPTQLKQKEKPASSLQQVSHALPQFFYQRFIPLTVKFPPSVSNFYEKKLLLIKEVSITEKKTVKANSN